jgi:hypothetical protein
MISRLLLPSAVRLPTYCCVRGSRRIRARQIIYSALLWPPGSLLYVETSRAETWTRETKRRMLIILKASVHFSRGCACRRMSQLLFATHPYRYVMFELLGLRSNAERCD